jgi:hypothetical protein
MKPARMLQVVVPALILASVPIVYSVHAGDKPDEGPKYIAGNPSCPVGDYEFKIEDPKTGKHVAPSGLVIDLTYKNKTIDFTANIGILAVLVKGGPGSNYYKYSPPVYWAKGLTAPNKVDVSHVRFCYDMALEISKTAKTSHARQWKWTIEKFSKIKKLFLSKGKKHTVPYVVDLNAESSSTCTVSGDVVINNPAKKTATIKSIVDELSDGTPITVDCGKSFSLPYDLGPGKTLTCSYFTELKHCKDGVNTVTVETKGAVKGGSATADVKFGKAQETDACVKVFDDQHPDGFIGTICHDSKKQQLEYTLDVGGDCGESKFTNTATFKAVDSGAKGSDSHTIKVEVDCDKGCTLTQGYWRTHSKYGPAPYDDTWAKLPKGADTKFFSSKQSYYEVLWTPPQGGNVCYILAVQYIAAELNKLSGADFGDIKGTFEDAKAMLKDQKNFDKCTLDKKKATALAKKLDDYNNGRIGPGHCSE